MTDYPDLAFKREPVKHEKTRWSVYFEDHLLGSVYSLYSGGWTNKYEDALDAVHEEFGGW